MKEDYYTLWYEFEYIGVVSAITSGELTDKVLLLIENYFDTIEVALCYKAEFFGMRRDDFFEFKAVVEGDVKIFSIKRQGTCFINYI